MGSQFITPSFVVVVVVVVVASVVVVVVVRKSLQCNGTTKVHFYKAHRWIVTLQCAPSFVLILKTTSTYNSSLTCPKYPS